MALELVETEDDTVRYYGWPITIYKGHTIGMEHLNDNYQEIATLHQAHWEETERGYMGGDANIDYGRACLLEAEGKLVMVTVRDGNGYLVGSVLYFLSMSLHAKDCVQAVEDVFFLSKKARSGALAIKLLNYAEQCLIDLGVTYIFHASKHPSGGKDLGKLFERRGYQPVAATYVKQLIPTTETVH